MRTLLILAAMIVFSKTTTGSDENPDMDFLEWLGQVSDVEELGVDVDDLLELQESKSNDSEQEQSE